MRDVTLITGDSTVTTIQIPGGTPFSVEVRDGVAGHYKPHTKQSKEGQATKREWQAGIPDEVWDVWVAPAESGYVAAPPPEKKATPSKPATPPKKISATPKTASRK